MDPTKELFTPISVVILSPLFNLFLQLLHSVCCQRHLAQMEKEAKRLRNWAAVKSEVVEWFEIGPRFLKSLNVLFFFFFLKISFVCFFFNTLFIYLFMAALGLLVFVWGLSLVAASGGRSSSRCAGLSLSRPLPLRGTGSRRAGSVVVAHGPSCSAACGIFPNQGSNPCPLH